MTGRAALCRKDIDQTSEKDGKLWECIYDKLADIETIMQIPNDRASVLNQSLKTEASPP